jgi:hypothetical protein
MALPGTDDRLYALDSSPLIVRAPAMAAASAAFWHCARAIAIMPRSIARAKVPAKPTIAAAVNGTMDPRRRWVIVQFRMFVPLDSA